MKIGIALSGGGIRGIAHAGVLQALEEKGIKPDIIGGTSCGSMIAILYAMGYSPYHIYILFKRYAKTITKINNISLLSGIKNGFLNGFNNGEKLEEEYNRLAKRRNIENISKIKMPIVIPSVDMKTGKEVVFTNKKSGNTNPTKMYIDNISIGKAVRASSSFPRIF